MNNRSLSWILLPYRPAVDNDIDPGWTIHLTLVTWILVTQQQQHQLTHAATTMQLITTPAKPEHAVHTLACLVNRITARTAVYSSDYGNPGGWLNYLFLGGGWLITLNNAVSWMPYFCSAASAISNEPSTEERQKFSQQACDEKGDNNGSTGVF